MNKRRNFIKFSGLFIASLYLTGCERHRYVREEQQKGLELDLGTVRSLLFNQVHLPIKSVIVFRDLDGWRVLSTRCTYEGCDLTLQSDNGPLFCPCCQSAFDIFGKPLADSQAILNLPWMEIFYKEGHLYAQPGKVVDSTYRFSDPKIEDAVRKLRMQVRKENVADGVKIPEALLGGNDPDEEKSMFVDPASIIP